VSAAGSRSAVSIAIKRCAAPPRRAAPAAHRAAAPRAAAGPFRIVGHTPSAARGARRARGRRPAGAAETSRAPGRARDRPGLTVEADHPGPRPDRDPLLTEHGAPQRPLHERPYEGVRLVEVRDAPPPPVSVLVWPASRQVRMGTTVKRARTRRRQSTPSAPSPSWERAGASATSPITRSSASGPVPATASLPGAPSRRG